jgi:molecular chaperone DnaK (HSP70)
MSEYIGGISLGNTSACVISVNNERFEPVANFEGNRVTPVRVSLNESLPFVDGISADSNSIGGMRALIGRKFGEESVQ